MKDDSFNISLGAGLAVFFMVWALMTILKFPSSQSMAIAVVIGFIVFINTYLSLTGRTTLYERLYDLIFNRFHTKK